MTEIVKVFQEGRAERLSSSILDCTLGGGGHAMALLESGATVTGLDRDLQAIAAATERGAAYIAAGRFQTMQGDFTRIDEMAALETCQFDGILADLGVSSHQIDSDARGFSFRPGVPLDMRMAGSDNGGTVIPRGESAAELLNTASEEELAHVFRDYGDEPKSRRLAKEIVHRRANRPFQTSDDLVGAIRGTLGPKSGPSDFARLFQAVRIAVNDELAGLERALPLLRDHLAPRGILAIIAYHSGEDRLVKHAMREWSVACHCPPRQPVCTCAGTALGHLVFRKAIVPTTEEGEQNPRARSAKLRVWQKAA